MFIEMERVGFTNETREVENDDRLSGVTFDDEIEQCNAESEEKTEMEVEGPQVETKEESSSSGDSENYVDITTTMIPNSQVQVQEVTPSRSDRVFHARPSRIPILQECY